MQQEQMEYRELNLTDYGAILDLWKNTEGVGLRDSDSFEGIAKYLKRNPGLSFVAVKDEKVIGTIMSGHDGKRGYIQHLAVHHDYRKMGVATKLIDLALVALSADGILKSHIHIFANNFEGKKYWSNRGWLERKDVVIYSFINCENKNA